MFLVVSKLGAFGNVHPNCIRLICDFHTLQAVERWVNCSQHCIPSEQKIAVKAAFKKLVYAKTGQLVNIDNTCHTQIHDIVPIRIEGEYDKVLSGITASQWYTSNDQLQCYLQNEWLNCKPVSVLCPLVSISDKCDVFTIHSFGLTYTGNNITAVLTPTTSQRHSTMFSKIITSTFAMTSQCFHLSRHSSSVSFQIKKESTPS